MINTISDVLLPLFYIVAGLLAASLDLKAAFAITIRVVGEERDYRKLNLFQKLWAAKFIIRDVVYNFTWGSLLFWEFASWERKTLTERLKHILHSGEYEETDKRFRLALYLCKYWIEPEDPGHCALSKLQ